MLNALDDFVVFPTNLVHIVGKGDWRTEIYKLKYLKFFSKTAIKLALFFFIIGAYVFYLKNCFYNKKTVCTFYMTLAASNMNKQESLIR